MDIDENNSLDTSADSLSSDECFHVNETAAMQEKDNNVKTMVQLAEQYKETIANLRNEIQTLENEKSQLAAKDTKLKLAQGSTDTKMKSTLDSTKIQKELLEKTKILETKQKLLRQKEIEYAKIYQQKEQARKDAEQLRQELTEALRKRVEISRKLKEETDVHIAERKRLQNAEIQSRKRELEAQNIVVKLNKEFTNRERILKGRLEEKDREVKRQKELILKQQKVKSIRETSAAIVASKRFSGMGTSSLSVNLTEQQTISSEYSLSTQRLASLDTWLSEEVSTQSKRNILHEDIQIMMDSRAKASRRLHVLKSQRTATEISTSNNNGIAASNNNEVKLNNEVKQLEEEVRSRSIVLAKHQGMLADLGTVVEKRRFAGITDPKEAKYIMNWMFQVFILLYSILIYYVHIYIYPYNAYDDITEIE